METFVEKRELPRCNNKRKLLFGQLQNSEFDK